MPVAFLKKLLFFKEKTFLEIEKKILLSTTNTLKPAQTHISKVFWLLYKEKTFLEIGKDILLSTTNTQKPAQTNSSKVFWLLFSKK